MKRNSITVVAVLAILAALALTGCVETLVVGDSTGQFPTITAASNAAKPGDTVLVTDGWYEEGLLHLRDGVSYLGTSSAEVDLGNTTVVAECLGCEFAEFSVHSTKFNILGNSRLTLRNVVASSGPYGYDEAFVTIRDQASPTIHNNTIYLCGNGIYAEATTSPTIANNLIAQNNRKGIEVGELTEGDTAGSPSITYNLLWNNQDGDTAGFEPCQTNIFQDPSWLSGMGDDWDKYPLISRYSPAVDAGDPTYGGYDIDGSNPEIGAVMASFGNIYAYVDTPEGLPASGVIVRMYSNDGWYYSDYYQTDQYGGVSFSGIPTGNYTVMIDHVHEVVGDRYQYIEIGSDQSEWVDFIAIPPEFEIGTLAASFNPSTPTGVQVPSSSDLVAIIDATLSNDEDQNADKLALDFFYAGQGVADVQSITVRDDYGDVIGTSGGFTGTSIGVEINISSAGEWMAGDTKTLSVYIDSTDMPQGVTLYNSLVINVAYVKTLGVDSGEEITSNSATNPGVLQY